jgi:AraC-like DNA-binding protein
MAPAGRSGDRDGGEPSPSARWQLLALDLPRSTGFGRHAHDEHQLVLVRHGTIGLVTPAVVWALPAGCGAWLPAGEDHGVLAITDAAVTFAYVATSTAWAVPPAGAVTVAPLLREAITQLGTPGAVRGDRRRRLESVAFDELRDLRPVQLLVPLPSDPAARQAAVAMLDDPRDRRTVDQLGAMVGASGRTLQRRFTDETGLGFRDWRRRARLQRAMVELEAGQPVTAAAHTCGFSSASAFVTAFRSELGVTPGEWARSARR